MKTKERKRMVELEWHALRLAYFYRFIRCRGKSNLNCLGNAKFASFVQKVALMLKIIILILKSHSENSSIANLMFRKLKTQELMKSLGSHFSALASKRSLKFRYAKRAFTCENRLKVRVR